MARPPRNTVDYFPHYIGSGKKMFFIEQKYGNDGYATWFKILEKLGQTENHFLNLNNEEDVLFLSASCRVDETRLLNIINDLVKIGVFDRELWESKIIWSSEFVESIQDAYSKRNNKCITLDGLRVLLTGLRVLKLSNGSTKGDGNTQSKVKYSKEDESKAKESKAKESLWSDDHPLKFHILSNYPTILKLRALTTEECEKLLKSNTKQEINDVLMAMENFKGLEKKYKDAYLTINSWLGIRKKKQTNGNKQFTTESKQEAIARKLAEDKRATAERLANALGGNHPSF